MIKKKIIIKEKGRREGKRDGERKEKREWRGRKEKEMKEGERKVAPAGNAFSKEVARNHNGE